ncbi:TetR/AcrR family transcriptional regulator [Pleomorphomonas diazotrophica]|uniref:TetR/AcrR family transcriptional regulator n=1 Tax=Pleomorphomonas diazotrophica TaxID=1166257 RepID=A0A1I4V347_9HYPH|nr:TetR/AcrR family transcriptional regulator [Pleomorphomonas diazotrophica]PKR88719.1 TetR/AcrR family transcriptional regulator [Pleomorphomonas diazotrophica]SFM95602.1 DNA-binding transcriptional regulator, AcrR family [Pleomorphomonas diazotrophica]
MPAKLPITLEPRKAPRQARSEATVDAIFEATVQVLMAGNTRYLTTTRVARRAGVSVGTLYQYFPHKEALLYALIGACLQKVATRVEHVCREHRGMPAEMASDALVSAYIDTKVRDVETARALYLASAEIDVMDLVSAAYGRFRQAAAGMFATAPDGGLGDIDRVSFNLIAMLTGATRVAVESGLDARDLQGFREQMMLTCRTCLRGDLARTG